MFLGEPYERAEILTTIAAAVGVCLMVRPAFIFSGGDDDAWTADIGSSGLFGKSSGSNRQEAVSGEVGEQEGPSREENTLGVIFALIGSLGAAGAYVMIRIMGTRVKVRKSAQDWEFEDALSYNSCLV
jgi:drug/metabolite transporter (DMT)-like permease